MGLSGKVRTLTAWCEGRQDFRSFRVDRIVAVTPTGEVFPIEDGRSLEDYRARMTEAIPPEPEPVRPETQSSGPAGS